MARWCAGALQLFAAFDTRSGTVYAGQFRRKRQVEHIQFLAHLDRLIPAPITALHLVCDNVSVHHGKAVRAWLAAHPRFVLHFLPVHCSWMNQVEQRFSILRRKRLRTAAFAGLAELAGKIEELIDQWNETAHPFRWTAASFDRVLAEAVAALPPAPPLRQAAQWGTIFRGAVLSRSGRRMAAGPSPGCRRRNRRGAV